MTNPTPYLIFQGNCREAMATYAEIFGGRIEMMLTAAEMPGFDAPPDKADWIMHSMIGFGGGQLMGSDDIMGGNGAMAGCSVMMTLPTTAAAHAAFEALAEGGTPVMPFGPTQWATGFGLLTDRFGTSWMISGPDGEA